MELLLQDIQLLLLPPTQLEAIHLLLLLPTGPIQPHLLQQHQPMERLLLIQATQHPLLQVVIQVHRLLVVTQVHQLPDTQLPLEQVIRQHLELDTRPLLVTQLSLQLSTLQEGILLNKVVTILHQEAIDFDIA